MRLLALILLVITGCSISIEFNKKNKKEIYELEKSKLIEIYNHNKEIYEIIKRIYDKNEKIISTCQLKEAELKLKLSEIDVKIKELAH